MNEIEIIRKAQHGDKHAFGLLVQKYKRQAYFSALAIVASHDDALDVSQQAFIRAYRAFDRFNVEKKFFTWFYKILCNLCLNRIRDNAHRAKPFSIFETEPEPVDTCDDPSMQLEREQLCASVRRAIEQLRPEEREIILMREFEEQTYIEISEILECPVGTVMSRLFYARKHLRDLLENTI